MIINNFPNNSDEFIGAEEVMKWLHGRTSGVFGAQNNARVSAVDGSMAVSISDGVGWITDANGNGCVWWSDLESRGESLILQIDPASSALDRIDRVIVQWDTTKYINKPEIVILKGTASSAPTFPALTNNSVLRQLSLASIYIKAGVIAVTPSMITDERLNPDVCGLVTEQVSIDTSDLNLKYLAALAEMRKAIEEAWDGEIPAGSVSMVYGAVIGTSWTGEDPYTQTVSAPGVLATDTPIVDIVASDDYDTASAQIDAYGNIYRIVAANNSLTVYATSETDVDIPIQIRCIRK